MVNQKIYIGYTDNLENRINEHRMAMNHYDFVLYKAFRKYGFENFKWETLYASLDKDHCKNTMEKHFIEEYKSFIGFNDCNGYNMTLGGEGHTGKKTKEHLEKIKVSLTGKKRSLEFKQKCSLIKSKKWLLTDKNGTKIQVENLHKFCKENKLSSGAMCNLHKGKTSHHKDWVLVESINN